MAKIIILCSFAESLIQLRQEMIRSMAQRHQVVACAPDLTPNIVQQLQDWGVRGCKVALQRTGMNPWRDCQTLWALYQLFKRERPDYLFSYTMKPVIYGSFVAKWVGNCQIYSMITGLGSFFIHQNFKTRMFRKFICYLYRWAMRYNQVVFFQNLDDKQEFIQHKIIPTNQKTVRTYGSGVNLQHFQPQPKLKAEPFVFLTVARLIKAKGIREYVEAASIIRQRYPQVECWIVGWFDQKSEVICQQDMQQWVAKGWVKHLGQLADVREALHQCSVFVLPSYREGTPKTVLEAMACGRPIITTDVPGCRETVITGKNGFLVPARDALELANAMERFIETPTLLETMGRASRTLAEAKFDVHRVNDVILSAMGLTEAAAG